MIFGLLGDLVVWVHFGFILFVVFGGIFAFRWPWVVWLHLPAVSWGAWVELAGRICPLTPLENNLRRLGGEAGYSGDFVEHYLMPLVYPPGLTRPSQLLMGLGVIAVNLFVYAALLSRRRRRERSE